MICCSPIAVSRRRSYSRSWVRRFHAVVAIGVVLAILLPAAAGAHPHTRDGFFIGLGLARGSAALGSGARSTPREGGSGGSFRMGYAINPKFALGLENNSWFTWGEGGAVTLGTFNAAASFFPAEGLVLRAGMGGGYVAGFGDGTSGEVGTGWTVGGAYEFRVTPSFAIGPQIDYGHVKLRYVDGNYINVGLLLNWY